MKNPCQKLLLRHFPVTEMLTQQVHYTLASFHYIDHVICSNEADREVALALHKSPTTFSVGLDSVYCLFLNIKYVPLDYNSCHWQHLSLQRSSPGRIWQSFWTNPANRAW